METKLPISKDAAAPYAPPSGILSIVERHRSKGLPSPVDSDTLIRAGISESLISRTLQALTALDLIDKQGNPSQVLEGLRLASESEYKDRMAEWLRNAYADALSFIEPDSDETAIRDAFRSYKPVGQQNRMVTLFIGLFAAAGLREPVERKTQQAATNKPPRRKGETKQKPSDRADAPGNMNGHFGSHHNEIPAALPPALAGLLQSLPGSDRGWTEEKRNQFLTVLGATLDFYIPVIKNVDEEYGKTHTGEGDEET